MTANTRNINAADELSDTHALHAQADTFARAYGIALLPDALSELRLPCTKRFRPIYGWP